MGGLRTSTSLSPTDYAGMMAGKKRLYVAVVVQYEDTFGNSRETRLFAHTGGRLFSVADAKARADGLVKCEVDWTVARKGNTAT